MATSLSPSASLPTVQSLPRIPLIDAARGIALLAMISYHFAWDLSFYGLIETDIAAHPAWRIYAHLIAGSFLALVGVSLVLAHANGINRRSFLRRLAILVAAAAAVTVGTYFLFPESFIFFGILHEIALASVLGLFFLRLPWIITLAAAAVALALPLVAASPFFNAPALLWLGLATEVPETNDYVPLFPWFGCVLLGMALAQIVLGRPALPAWLTWRVPGVLGRGLTLAGRHSLLVYLTHQLVLLGALWVFVQVVQPVRTAPFLRSCEATCQNGGTDAATCARYCGCVGDGVAQLGLWGKVAANALSPEDRQRLAGMARQCRPASPPAGAE
ncbi:heparan-alpha-glucosaminide N-acetyltransferase [Chelatococcus sp. GCM10030263]|uniref:heparan-alpha-glucosaminide N-acetyltransferase n=1 Tax=Chelatococcus sp. GCM10030263 TaxID=3273387 RepID=UPI0036146CFA